MTHIYFSQRNSLNPHPEGLPLADILELFSRVFKQFESDGYFVQAFGFQCVDAGYVPGDLADIDLAILLAMRKKDLWPIQLFHKNYSEHDLFDMIEFLYQQVSKPAIGTLHNYGDCGMHWEVFDKPEGKAEFRKKINELLSHYERGFELTKDGEVLSKPALGFEKLVSAEMPTDEEKVTERVSAAISRYRRFGATLDDRRQAVRDLVDVLEYLKPKIKVRLSSADEKDLFNIANNFGIRHHNDKQKTSYDANIWLSWMFYFYLSTIHVVLRSPDKNEAAKG